MSSSLIQLKHSVYALFLILFCTILLSSCSHVSRKDGPPNYYVDVSKIPNAVPKPERLSKYGNMPYYNVFGRRYYTLKSSQHYNEIGIASWYGTKFHEHKTSSGEPYNMLAMTAAHKTLPLPTYVEVTNLRNHLKIIVKVNDRGPFASNRIIDLSYVAARKLNIVGHGTAYVRVKAINPYTFGRDDYFVASKHNVSRKRVYTDYLNVEPSAKHSYAQAHKSNRYLYLQVGAFRNKAHAVNLKRHLASLLTAPVQISNSRSKHKFLVHVGPIKDLATADKISIKLKRLGISSTRYR